MADLREFVILNPRFLSYEKESRLKQQIGDGRMALRRFVLRTSALPVFRSVYAAAYRFHIWVLLQVLQRYKGTRAVYLTSGMGKGDIRYGVSDIDVVIFGDWPEKRQLRLIALLAVLIAVMPLLDRESLGRVQTWEDFLHIHNTNLFFSYFYASAKRDWKLLWGEDLIQNAPDLSPERRAGAAYMEVRRWWVIFIKMALGKSVTSRDAVFRNSMSFKAVADILRAAALAQGKLLPNDRIELLRQELHSDQPLLDQLLQTEASRFLSADVELRAVTLSWLLAYIEQMHTWLPATATFQSAAAFRVMAEPEDRLLSPEAAQHVERLADHAAKWSGFRAAYLLPSVQFLMPDTVGLFLEVDAKQVPTVNELRALCSMHLETSAKLTQRVRIYLLLEHGAYLLDFLYGSEIWGSILIPQTSPDIFNMLSRPEFVLRGVPRPAATGARWSKIAQQNMAEEFAIRTRAYKRAGLVSRTPLDNLRNLWRYLQLWVMAQRTGEGEIVLPSTVAATRSMVAALVPELAEHLRPLEQAMCDAVNGHTAATDPLIEKLAASEAFQAVFRSASASA